MWGTVSQQRRRVMIGAAVIAGLILVAVCAIGISLLLNFRPSTPELRALQAFREDAHAAPLGEISCEYFNDPPPWEPGRPFLRYIVSGVSMEDFKNFYLENGFEDPYPYQTEDFLTLRSREAGVSILYSAVAPSADADRTNDVECVLPTAGGVAVNAFS